MKKFASSLILGAWALAALGGDIVHRPNMDLVLNAAGAGVYTNVHGGVWSYCYASSWNGGDRIPMAVPVRTTYNGGQIRGVSRYSGISDKNDFGVPYVLVNATHTATNCAVLAPGPIGPVQIVMHPGKNTDCILRFVAPRARSYSGTFAFRAIGSGAGTVTAHVLVNGQSQFASGMTHRDNLAQDAAERTTAFALEPTALDAGDTIEIVLVRQDDFYNDAVVVDAEIVEADGGDVWFEPIDTVPLFCMTNYSGSGARGEEWQPVYVPSPEDYLRNALSPGFVSERNGMALIGQKWTSAYQKTYPYFLINTNAVLTQGLDCDRHRELLPGEMLMHPGDKQSVGLSFRCPASGTYDVRVSARDMCANAEGAGVSVSLVRDGEVLATCFVKDEGTDAVPSATLELQGLQLFGREPLDLVVDNAGIFYGDATAVTLAIRKTADGLPDGWIGLSEAFRANIESAAPMNPFMDSDGVTWTFGQSASLFAELTPFSSHKAYAGNGIADAFKGWYTGVRPYMAENLQSGVLSADRFIVANNQGEGKGDIAPGEIALHPGDRGVYAKARFTAPSNGVYGVHACFRHLNTTGDGIDVSVVVRNADLVASISNVLNRGGHRIAGVVHEPALHLQAGDTVDFAVGAGPSRGYECDLTGLQAAMIPGEGASAARVNLDLNAKGGATFVGRGRVGGPDETTWNALEVEADARQAASRQLRLADGRGRTGVIVTLQDATSGILRTRLEEGGHALQGDGVLSDGSSDVCAFTVSGLLPGASYDFWLYSHDAAGGPGRFTLQGGAASSTHPWFNAEGGDCALISATANEEGVVTGTFCGSAPDKSAVFTGLQIAGPGFGVYKPKGVALYIR